MISLTDLIWALVGLFLTIGGTLIEAFTTNAPWQWGETGLEFQSLGVSFQIGAVLLVGCLGGKNAAAMSQIAYLALGIVWFDIFQFQIFDQGGGLNYIQQPTFGYLLGFIPGAWVCGYFAFQERPKLEILGFSCLMGLLAIHVVGLVYLSAAYLVGWVDTSLLSYGQAVLAYSIYRIPGHLIMACIIAVLSMSLRRLMFY